jgi:hypothetical protein
VDGHNKRVVESEVAQESHFHKIRDNKLLADVAAYLWPQNTAVPFEDLSAFFRVEPVVEREYSQFEA